MSGATMRAVVPMTRAPNLRHAAALVQEVPFDAIAAAHRILGEKRNAGKRIVRAG